MVFDVIKTLRGLIHPLNPEERERGGGGYDIRLQLWSGNQETYPVLEIPRQCPFALLVEIMHIIRTNFQTYSVSGLFPSSGILNSYKTLRFGNWICFHLQVIGARHLLFWVP
jgi:hypothetical protein